MEKIYKRCIVFSLITVVIIGLKLFGVADLQFTILFLLLNIFASIISLSLALANLINGRNDNN